MRNKGRGRRWINKKSLTKELVIGAVSCEIISIFLHQQNPTKKKKKKRTKNKNKEIKRP